MHRYPPGQGGGHYKLNWLGHVERMAEDNIVQKIKRWKPMSKRPIGRPKTRWEDEDLEDIKSINIHNWKKVAQDIDSWNKVVEQGRTLYTLYRYIRRSVLICCSCMACCNVCVPNLELLLHDQGK